VEIGDQGGGLSTRGHDDTTKRDVTLERKAQRGQRNDGLQREERKKAHGTVGGERIAGKKELHGGVTRGALNFTGARKTDIAEDPKGDPRLKF